MTRLMAQSVGMRVLEKPTHVVELRWILDAKLVTPWGIEPQLQG